MELKITIKDRSGKKSLWVPIPNPYDDKFTPHNIWDLPPELAYNPEVQKAISHAFELGSLAQSNLAKRATANNAIDVEFR